MPHVGNQWKPNGLSDWSMIHNDSYMEAKKLIRFDLIRPLKKSIYVLSVDFGVDVLSVTLRTSTQVKCWRSVSKWCSKIVDIYKWILSNRPARESATLMVYSAEGNMWGSQVPEFKAIKANR
jgi:hypothetical protein